MHQGIYFQKFIFDITLVLQHIIKFCFLQMIMYQNFYEIKGLFPWQQPQICHNLHNNWLFTAMEILFINIYAATL